MRRVLIALMSEMAVSAALTVWGVRMLTKAETGIPLFGELPVEGLSPEMFGLLLTAASAVTLLVALWRLIPLARCLWLERTLKGEGIAIRGVITDMRNCRVIRVNQTYSVRLTIRCTAPSGREEEFVSPVIWAPEAQVGDAIDVIFDPMDEQRYFIRLVEKKYVRDSLKESKKGRVL